jgi:arginine:ornithine antiporter / lysine permease
MVSTEQKMSLYPTESSGGEGMVGPGICALARTFANATGPFGGFAGLIASTGMYGLPRL